MARGSVIGVGIVFLGIAIIGYIIPIDDGYALPQATSVCNSEMGQFSQASDDYIMKACSEFQMMLYGVYGSGLVGIILLIVGAAIPKSKGKSLTCKYCNFVGMSEQELEKHNSENHLDKYPYKCEHCDFIGISEEILRNHYTDGHPDKYE